MSPYSSLTPVNPKQMRWSAQVVVFVFYDEPDSTQDATSKWLALLWDGTGMFLCQHFKQYGMFPPRLLPLSLMGDAPIPGSSSSSHIDGLETGCMYLGKCGEMWTVFSKCMTITSRNRHTDIRLHQFQTGISWRGPDFWINRWNQSSQNNLVQCGSCIADWDVCEDID